MITDFAEPLQLTGSGGGAGGAQFVPSEDSITVLMGLGFTREQCVRGLKATVSDC